MLGRGQRVLDHVLDVDVDVYLLQSMPHRTGFEICQHHELGIGRGLVVVEFVL